MIRNLRNMMDLYINIRGIIVAETKISADIRNRNQKPLKSKPPPEA